MKVREFMTTNPAVATADEPLSEIARKMVEHDCGEIPIVESAGDPRPVGVVTDRDIACRAVAEGRNPLELRARDVMSQPVVTVTPETTLEECCDIMEKHQIRRVPVADGDGGCCGIVSQADIARAAPPEETAEVVRDISEPTGRTRHAMS